MIVDVHTHLWETPDQLGPDAAQRLRSGSIEPWRRPEASLTALDEGTHVANHAVIVGFTSQLLKADIPLPQIARYVAHAPHRYFGFGGIDPMAHGYLDRFKQARDLGLVGVTISPPAQGCHPTHTRAMRLYERCESHQMPLLVHPGYNFSPQSQLEFGVPYLFDEVARSFPRLKIVLAQIGYPWVDQALVMLSKHGNIYVDISDVADRPWELYHVLLSAHQLGVLDRFLLGSNFPFSTTEKVISNIYSLNSLAQGTHLPIVPREQLRLLVERDALACLGIRTGNQEHPPAPAQPTLPPIKGGVV